jgi:hypothetical protein
MSASVSDFSINSFNAMRQGWAVPHVKQECTKRRSPSIAYPYSSGTVPLVTYFRLLVASVFHRSPRFPCRTMAHSVCCTQFVLCCPSASTAFCVSAKQMARINDNRSPAVTQAVPHCQQPAFASNAFSPRHRQKASKLNSNNVMWFPAHFSPHALSSR